MLRRNPFRAALAAALPVVALATVPAFAAAVPTCSYTPSTHTATVFDDDSTDAVTIFRFGDFIAVRNVTNPNGNACSASSEQLATVTNTDQVNVKAITHKGPGIPRDGVVIDESNGPLAPGFTPETDGGSEVEVNVQNITPLVDKPFLAVDGTPQADIIRVGDAGVVNLDLDFDADFTLLGGPPSFVRVVGGAGADFLSGQGDGFHRPSSVAVGMFGGDNDDVIFGGNAGDTLSGDAGNDSLHSDDQSSDFVEGGPDFDNATLDSRDREVDTIESKFTQPVGKLQVAPKQLSAHPGMIARLALTWTHPKAWRELRTVDVQLYAGKTAVGTIALHPGAGAMVARGAVKLAPGSKLSHKGRMVSASLGLELARKLGGQDLRIAVQATDRHGRTQLEPAVGRVHVAR